MASEYEIITIAKLEAYAGTDYSSVNSDYTDTVIEAQISSAERKVLGRCNDIYTSSNIPVTPLELIYTIAKQLMTNLMIENGEEEGTKKTDFEELLKTLDGKQDSKERSVWWEKVG